MKAYNWECKVCLALKAIRHKPYNDLQSLLVLTHFLLDLSIDFIIDFHYQRVRKGIAMIQFLSLWTTSKNGSLQANKDYNKCSKSSKSYYWYGSKILQPSQINYQW